MYVRYKKSKVIRPVKQLVGFERTSLNPGETKTVKFFTPAKDFAFWDVKKKTFVVEPGAFEFMAGSSSADIRAKAEFVVN